MLNGYTPSAWFWIVGGDESRVWSGKAAAYVPADDADYAAWLSAGNVPSRILNESELVDVLASFVATVKPGPDVNLEAQLTALGAE